MSKPLKIVLVAVGALVALCLLAVLLVPVFVPLESMITQAVEESTGRPAKISSASLSILGGVSVEVEGLEVAELPEFGERPFLLLKHLECDIALMPLMSSVLEVEDFRVEGLELSLVRDKQGRLNLQTMAQAGKKPAAAASPARRDEDHKDKINLFIHKAVVADSKVWLTNLANGQSSDIPLEECRLSLELDQYGSNLDLVVKMPGLSLAASPSERSGPGHAGHLALKVDAAEFGRRLKVVLPELASRGTLQADFDLAGDGKTFMSKGKLSVQDLLLAPQGEGKPSLSLADLNFTVDAQGNKERETLKLNQWELVSVDAGVDIKAKGSFGMGEDQRTTKGSVTAQLDLARLGAALAALDSQLSKARGKIVSEVSLTGSLDGSLAIKGQTGAQGLSLPGDGDKPAYSDQTVNLIYDLIVGKAGNRLDLNKFSLQSTPAQLEITGLMRQVEADRVSLEFQIKGDHLNLDRVNDLAGIQLLAAPAAVKTPTQATPAAKAGGAAAGSAADPAEELRQALKGLSALFTLDIGKITYLDLEMTDLKSELRVQDGVAKIMKLTARPLGGYMQTVGSLDSTPEQIASSLNLRTESMKMDRGAMTKLRKLMPAFNLPIAGMEGQLNLASNLVFKGIVPGVIKQTLNGQGTLEAPKGVRLELGFMDGLPLIQGLPTEFHKMVGSFTIQKQRLDYDLKFYDEAEERQAVLAGYTNLADLSVEATLSVAKEAVGPALRPYLDEDGTLPIALGGTVDKPRPKLVITPGQTAPIKDLIKGIFDRK